MGDETIRGINRVFDWLDSSVEAVDRVINRKQHLEESHKARRGSRHSVIDADPSSEKPQASKAKNSAAPSSSAAVAKKPHFYIMESIDPASGKTLYVVTDGGAARTECSTREFAASILRALEKAP